MENQEQMNQEQLQEAMLNERAEMDKKYDELFDQLEKGGYFKQTYGKDSKVTIPGSLFNSFIYFNLFFNTLVVTSISYINFFFIIRFIYIEFCYNIRIISIIFY